MLRKATSKPAKRVKPSKPYPEFPLTAHPNGQWAKKIKGRLRYFGPWDDPQAALNEYLDQRDELQAGREPCPADGLTVAKLVDSFLKAKENRLAAGEITARTLADYKRVCAKIKETLGKRSLNRLHVTDFEALRAELSQCGPTMQKNQLTYARMVFNYANENGMTDKPLRYKEPLKSPSAKTMRKMKNAQGSRMFTAKQIRDLISAAPLPLRAMILLGINAGFGNTDCALLTFDDLDLKAGWHSMPRPKTGNPRRCPLWPETVKTIKAAIAGRPECDLPYVFVTKYRTCWAKETGDNAISSEFRKLLRTVGCYTEWNTFYSLRRTCATIGSTSGETFAVSYILGHVPLTDDMTAKYRQKVYDAQLKRVTDRVRDWILGRVKID
jgi:integrase